MKSIFYTILIIILMALPVYYSSVVKAATSTCKGDTCKLSNPLGNVTEVSEVIALVIKGVLGIVGALALFFFIQGGFLWMTSAGNVERIKKGKDVMMWAAIGLLAVFASYSFLSFILQTIEGKT